MKKIICILLCLIIFIFPGCVNKYDNDSTTTTTETTTTESLITEESTGNAFSTDNTTETVISTTQNSINNQTESQTIVEDITTTKKNPNNSLISDEDIEKIENSNAEVFFTDNPKNKYIVTISEKYGVKKENLVALIKVNAEFPTTIVFEFSGKRDANGELIMNYDEFKNIYEIDENNNSIIKASKNGLNNDGLSFVEAKVYVLLAKQYLIPELPNLKENKQYVE